MNFFDASDETKTYSMYNMNNGDIGISLETSLEDDDSEEAFIFFTKEDALTFCDIFIFAAKDIYYDECRYLPYNVDDRISIKLKDFNNLIRETINEQIVVTDGKKTYRNCTMSGEIIAFGTEKLLCIKWHSPNYKWPVAYLVFEGRQEIETFLNKFAVTTLY